MITMNIGIMKKTALFTTLFLLIIIPLTNVSNAEISTPIPSNNQIFIF